MSRSIRGVVTFLLHYSDKRTRSLDIIAYGRTSQSMVQNAWEAAMHTVLAVSQPNLIKTEVSAVDGETLKDWYKQKDI